MGFGLLAGFEAQVVRWRLVRPRLERMEPTTLLLVLRLVFQNEYGMYRRMTCPMYGLTPMIIEDC